MNSDLIRGKTIRFTFGDGPMAKKTFEHVFDDGGTLSFRMIGGDAGASGKGDKQDKGDKSGETKKAPDPKYEIATIRDDLAAVSYLGAGGYTLTTLLDFKTKRLVAFSSNDKAVSVQHGTFEYGESSPARASSAQAHN